MLTAKTKIQTKDNQPIIRISLMSHQITNCKVCKKIISQCRCACCNKTQKYEVCDECKKGK